MQCLCVSYIVFVLFVTAVASSPKGLCEKIGPEQTEMNKNEEPTRESVEKVLDNIRHVQTILDWLPIISNNTSERSQDNVDNIIGLREILTNSPININEINTEETLPLIEKLLYNDNISNAKLVNELKNLIFPVIDEVLFKYYNANPRDTELVSIFTQKYSAAAKDLHNFIGKNLQAYFSKLRSYCQTQKEEALEINNTLQRQIEQLFVELKLLNVKEMQLAKQLSETEFYHKRLFWRSTLMSYELKSLNHKREIHLAEWCHDVMHTLSDTFDSDEIAVRRSGEPNDDEDLYTSSVTKWLYTNLQSKKDQFKLAVIHIVDSIHQYIDQLVYCRETRLQKAEDAKQTFNREAEKLTAEVLEKKKKIEEMILKQKSYLHDTDNLLQDIKRSRESIITFKSDIECYKRLLQEDLQFL